MYMDVLPLVLFCFVTLAHYGSLKLQAQNAWYTNRFGEKRGFLIHFSITAMLWAALYLAFLFRDSHADQPLPIFLSWFPATGTILIYLGVALAIWSIALLGSRRMWGIRYFVQEKNDSLVEQRGPYRFFKNPMYTGFFFIFLGTALAQNSLFYLTAALESFLLLNIFLADFENRGIETKKL